MSAGYDMSDPGWVVCRQVLLRAAEDWTDYLIGFETGPRAVTHRAALEMAVGMVKRFTHALLTDDVVAQKMGLLERDVRTLDSLTLYGTWEDEDDEVFAARTPEQRVEKAQQDVDFTVYGLLTGLNPCTDCASRRDFEQWAAPFLGRGRCAEHLDEHQAVLASRVDRRPLHSGEISSADFQLLHGGQQ